MRRKSYSVTLLHEIEITPDACPAPPASPAIDGPAGDFQGPDQPVASLATPAGSIGASSLDPSVHSDPGLVDPGGTAASGTANGKPVTAEPDPMKDA